MAGKPGRSGGARPGAGRKPQPKAPPAPPVLIEGDGDMLKLLQDVALGRVEASALQVRAAIAAVQYTHTKKGDGGKKDEQREKAGKVLKGRFGPAAPPTLVSSK